MKILYVNHTSSPSGAERSLLELAARMRQGADVVLAAPAGRLLEEGRSLGIDVVELEIPPVSFRSGVGSGVSSELVRAGLALRALARDLGADIVHAGSTRAGLVSALARPAAPRVVDVRDLLPRGQVGRLVRFVLRTSAEALVFNSAYTADSFGPAWPARSAVVPPAIAHNHLLELPIRGRGDPPTLGVVGQITPWKGQDDAIRTLALVRESIPETRLRIIGAVVFGGGRHSFDNEAYARSLPTLAKELGVADAVDFAGSTDDIGSALRALDVLLVPSWEEPFGRVVTEGMAAGVPVVATNRGGPTEQIQEGVTGFLVEPRSPSGWVEPVTRLLRDDDLRLEMIRLARRRVALAFDPAKSVRLVGRLYSGLTGAAEVPVARTPTTAGVER